MILQARKALSTGVVGAIAACAGVATLAAAQAAPQSVTPAAQAATGEVMPSAVEDFQYPGAAKIFKERGITLKQGDGRIVFVDCSTPNDIKVESRLDKQGYCFKVAGKKGFLAMELPDAYGIWTEDHPVKAKLTAEGKERVVDAPKNDYVALGEGDGGTEKKRSVLVELRVTG
ncbi:hypothetical protein [Streptomyces morookaense]|uniref:hypothetical protein n=1 Tax=Streptomyces morookaense TaxID=1970 RepID=UPI0019BAB685|nr:hypothetical protein [Streptomyces morookaense]GHF14301.1 secreted protein [Streptomyces morookaense]